MDVGIGETLPTNVIRIETEDGSGEYIEIEFDEDDNLKGINNNDDELNDLLHQAKDILYELSPLSSIESAYDNLKAGEYKDALLEAITIIPYAKALKAKKISAKIDKIISKDRAKKDVRIKAKGKSKYANRQEIINILKDKYKLSKTGNVYWAKDSKQIKEIWEDIAEGAEVLADTTNPRTGEKILMRKLSDGAILKLRRTSKTGGSTIEIETKGINNNKKIRNKAREDGDW